jgi:hypothetical protein
LSAFLFCLDFENTFAAFRKDETIFNDEANQVSLLIVETVLCNEPANAFFGGAFPAAFVISGHFEAFTLGNVDASAAAHESAVCLVVKSDSECEHYKGFSSKILTNLSNLTELTA